MSKLRLYGDTSGYLDVKAPDTADNSTLDLSTVAKTDDSIFVTTSNQEIRSIPDGQVAICNPRDTTDGWYTTAGIAGSSGSKYWALGLGGGNTYFGTGSSSSMQTAWYADGSGRVMMPNQPAFAARGLSNPNTNGYANNLPATLVFTTPSTNNGNHYNSSTGVFTVPVSGFYYFSWSVLVDDNSGTGQISNAKLYKNGVHVGFTSYDQNPGARYQQMSQSAVISCAANDQITINGAGVIHVGGESAFTGFLVG